jgi:hypothetical protein
LQSEDSNICLSPSETFNRTIESAPPKNEDVPTAAVGESPLADVPEVDPSELEKVKAEMASALAMSSLGDDDVANGSKVAEREVGIVKRAVEVDDDDSRHAVEINCPFSPTNFFLQSDRRSVLTLSPTSLRTPAPPPA